MAAALLAAAAPMEVIGDGGNNTLDGGEGDDTLDGLLGNDVLHGHGGDDVLIDGWTGTDEGVDSLYGDGGNDTIVVYFANGANYYDGGEGWDTLDLSLDTRGYSLIALGATFTQFGSTFTSFEHVWGTTGNDRVEGSAAGNFIFGNGGNDTLNGNGGDDEIVGGAGQDIVRGGDGNDILYDNYTVADGGSWYRGDAGDDTIVVYGAVAGDIFDGGADIDRLDLSQDSRGFNGTSAIDLSSGSFTAHGATFSNFEQVIGSQGNDHITGSTGDNLLYGEGGNDIIDAGGGADVIDGGDGTDTIHGGDGDDEFFDRDFVKDEIYGGTGDDIFHVIDSAVGSYFDGGAGNNSLDLSQIHYSPGTIYLDASAEGLDYFTLGGARFTNFSNVLGNGYNDDIRAYGALNLIDGGAGFDTISGIGDGSQIIFDQDTDHDYIDGGAGSDRIVIIGAANGRYDGGLHADMLDLSQASVAFAGLASIQLDGTTFVNGAGRFSGFEGVVGTRFADEILGSSTSNDIDGRGGSDRVLAGAGDDVIHDGDTTLDVLDGGEGDDTFLVSRATDGDRYDGGAGDGDLIDLSDSQTGFGTTRQLDLTGQGSIILSGFEHVIGTRFADRIVGASASETIRGGGGDDHVSGNDGDDVLEGGVGADTLDGGAGNNTASYEHAASGVTAKLVSSAQNLGEAQGDTYFSIANLIGSAHTDSLEGTASSNRLTGGLGADRLRGGLGDDRFAYTTAAESGVGAARDVIEDWEASDRFDFDAVDLDATLYGVQGFVWAGQGTAGGPLPQWQLKYYQQGGNTFIVGSVDADGVADFQVELSGLHTLTAAQMVGLGRVGTAGADNLIGAAGSQTFTFAAPHLTGADIVTGGADLDILTLTGAGNLDAARLAGVSGIETISLSNGGIALTLNDAVAGANGAALTVLASDGNDVVDASAVTAAGRALWVMAGTGNDVFRGGAGGDVFAFSAEGLTADDVVLGGSGPAIDTLVLTSYGQIDVGGVSGIERIVLADAPSTPTVDGDGNALTVTDALFAEIPGGVLTIVGGTGDNTVDASGVTDAGHGIDVTGGRGPNSFTGGAGSDVFRVSVEDYASLQADGGSGALDELVFTDAGEIYQTLFTSGIERIRLADGDNTFLLNTNVTTFDTLEVYGGNGADRLTSTSPGSSQRVTLRGFDGNDHLTGGFWEDRLHGGSGDDTLVGYMGNDRLEGGTGLDTYMFTDFWSHDTVNNYAEDHDLVGPDVLAFAYNVSPTDITVGRQGVDLILSRRGSSDQITVTGYGNGSAYQGLALRFYNGTTVSQEDLLWQFQRLGSEASQVMNGRDGNDDLVALGGDDTLYGHGGNDVLEGGTGADLLDGGSGADTAAYRYAAAGLTVDLANAANNTGEAAGDSYVSIENVMGTAFGDILVGNAEANVLSGGAGNDHFDGGLGVDQLHGGLGDDTFIISQTGDKAFELNNEGTDTVLSSISYNLAGQYIENLVLTGTSNTKATGNSANNLLTGNSGNNTLAGSLGSDTVDWSAATSALTVALDANGDGTVTGTGIGTDIFTGIENVIGGSGADHITGNAQNNRIDGGLGVDQMRGGSGNDTYVVSETGDKAFELDGEGTDTVISAISYNLSAQYVENVTLTGTRNSYVIGNSLNNIFIGNVGNNAFTGNDGADTVSFAAATSALTITIGATGNGSVTGAGIGTDTFSTIENIVGGMLGDTITGNASVNKLDGGLGNDWIDGGGGADKLYGGLGDDTFIVSDVGDKVYEAINEGIDTVRAAISFSLVGQYADNLTLTGSDAINATGNGLDNVLTGNSANNVLAGGAGSDTANFAAASSALAIVLSSSGAGSATGAGIGTDTFTGIENIIGGSADDTVTGNALANSFHGGAGNDRLDGGAGIDSLYGGTGDDIYILDYGDMVYENQNEGVDTVFTLATFSMLGQSIENVVLIGTSSISAYGNSMDNVLTGNTGVNLLLGAGGSDTANLAAATSSLFITLNANGHATVSATGIGTDILSEIENIIGGSADDTITGNAFDNRFDGGLGNDTLDGRGGNDTYVVDAAGDTIVEAEGEGIDTVMSAVSFSLAGRHVENITLTGSAAINAIGNSLDNVLTGNAGSNVLTGGGGNDTFIFNTALDGINNVDTITDWGYPDRILLDRAIFTALGDVGMINSSQFKDQHLAHVEPIDADDRIIFGTDQYLYYDADGSGDAAAIKIAYLPEITGWLGYTSIFIA